MVELVIRGARVYDTSGDVHQPPVQDISIVDGAIVAIGDVPASDTPSLDAGGLLALPGFVNAHHHSYDALARGLLENMPFDVWALHSQPAYLGPRSRKELRARTLMTALDCLRGGITTVQDMCSLVPFDEGTLDTILAAYEESGIRVVLSAAVRDVSALDIGPFLQDLPPDSLTHIAGSAPPATEQLAFVRAQLSRRPADGLFSWALSPSGPQRCTDELLDGIAALSADFGLPVFTHAYETKVQTARARDLYATSGGSMVRHLAQHGLLNERMNLVHAVWIGLSELDEVAAAGARVVHNPMSNLKLKSGIAPIARARAAGVEVTLGCDNCTCGDVQNMFEAMKLYCLLAAGTDPMPTSVDAVDALRAATSAGAAAVGRDDLGALRPGMRADIVLVDLADWAYQPFNSAARQVVYGETGRGLRHVLVDGRIVVRDGVVTTVDETALRAEIAELMPAFRSDFDANARLMARMTPHQLAALERVRNVDVGPSRLLDEHLGPIPS
jgi:5-methylthioadenosine/S-adenosylhomocysteine deaminase